MQGGWVCGCQEGSAAMCRSSGFTTILVALILAASGCGDNGGGGKKNEVGPTGNLSWEQDWEQTGASPPIEILSGPPRIGLPMKVRVRFLSEGEPGPVELSLRVVGTAPAAGGGEATGAVEEFTLGDFALDDPPVAPGVNIYEFEILLPGCLEPLMGKECSLAGILDPRNKIAETVEIPEGEPAEPASQGDNSLAVAFVLADKPKLTLEVENLKLEPAAQLFSTNEVREVAVYDWGVTFFGEDLNGTPARLTSAPHSDKAKADFLAAVGGVRVQDFESGFTDGQQIWGTVPITFTSSGGQEALGGTLYAGRKDTVKVRKAVAPGMVSGSFPTSGDFFVELSNPTTFGADIEINLPADQPQRAVGFYLTGLASAADNPLRVYLGGRNLATVPVDLPPIQDPARRSGSVIFFGMVLNSWTYDTIVLGFEGGLGSETCGVDDIIIASEIHTDPRYSKMAGNFAVSVKGLPQPLSQATMPVDVDFAIRSHEGITDALRAAGKLPIRAWTHSLAPAEGEPQVPCEPEQRDDRHIEFCPPIELLRSATDLMGEEPSLELTVDVTVSSIARPQYGMEASAKTAPVLWRFVTPPPPQGKEWNYFKTFGNDTIGGEVDFASGITVDGKGVSACAAGEFDVVLFGQRIESMLDTCARAYCDISSNPSLTSTTGLALQFRILSLGFEDGKPVARHQVLYEKRGEFRFEDATKPPTPTFDLQTYTGTASVPKFVPTAARVWLNAGGADGLVLGSRSAELCMSTVIYCIPVGVEFQIGGKVGIKTDFEVVRKADLVHEVSLLAGPYVSFYGGAEVFLGVCADKVTEMIDSEPLKAVVELSDLLECGKVVGARLDLTFLELLVGPKGYARLWPESRGGEPGVAAELGVDVAARVNLLKGKFSLWVHYLQPRLCWVQVAGRPVVPYVCAPFVECKEAGVTVASFPGFEWTIPLAALGSMSAWVPHTTGGSSCGGCPR